MQNEYRTRHLVAREPFHYDGRTLAVGERFSATPHHAMILEGLSKAKADDDVPTQASPAEDDDSRTVIATDDALSDTDAERAEKNRKRRERQQQRVLHTSKAD